MSAYAVLAFALLSVVCMVCGFGLYVVGQQNNRLRETQVKTADIREIVRGHHDAALLRRLADQWDAVEEKHTLTVLAREKYTPGGPSMPAIWLHDKADKIEQRFS